MMRVSLMVALLVVSACGGEPEQCETPRGTYLVEYDERPGGTCGAAADTLVVLDNLELADVECDPISQKESADQCRGDFDQSCDYLSDNVRMRQTGYIEIQDEKGNRLEGVFSVQVRRLDNNNAICSSTYDITLTKQ